MSFLFRILVYVDIDKVRGNNAALLSFKQFIEKKFLALLYYLHLITKIA